jgi:WD40 repeat protein
MAFSKEHPLFAAATESGDIAIWEVSSWYQLHKMKASESPIKSIQWSPKGNNLAVLNNDGEIQLLDPLTPNKQFTLPLRKHTNIIQWSHNSAQLYLAHENQLYLWDIASGSNPEPFGNHKTPIRSMTQPLESQAPNQSMLLTIEKNGTTHLWDINSGKDTLAFDVGPVSPTSIAIHPTEALVFVGTETGEIDVWSYSSQQLVHSWKAHHAPITHLWIQTQGRWLLSADNSQSIHQWSLADWQRRNTFATRQQSLTTAAVSPKQKWLTASYNQEAIALWSLRQQKEP